MRNNSDVLRSHVRWTARPAPTNRNITNNEDSQSSQNVENDRMGNNQEASFSEIHANLTINEHEDINAQLLGRIIVINNMEPFDTTPYSSPTYSFLEENERPE